MQLPPEYINQTRLALGLQRFEHYMQSFEEEQPVSIRMNTSSDIIPSQLSPVAWCRDGYYIECRPQFTFDPLLHAGCYYVQEASSMFLDHVLQTVLPTLGGSGPTASSGDAPTPLVAFDFCAAPGGKSAILSSRLPHGSLLVSNEPNPKRAQVLSENMQKWMLPSALDTAYPTTHAGQPKADDRQPILVTCNYPRDFRNAKLWSDLILCDVPCSGEGMFRKDPATIGEWSLQNVEKCQRLQRDIVSDAWQCLRRGGVLIYSTCTLNLKENEENIRWMTEELGAEPLPVPVLPDWHITGSLLPDFAAPVLRFIPGLTRGEGLFMAALRKPGTDDNYQSTAIKSLHRLIGSRLHVIPNTFLDSICEADAAGCPRVDVDYRQAISYLRREAITLPADVPCGQVIVTFKNHPLGLAKNIGNRANNLYPKEWRIKSTHIPQDYETVFRHSG
ncbi:MAG: hypothetical protein IJV36_08180 [Prevotella sp.]|nr:hypothetical protein [Prevotella sp.]